MQASDWLPISECKDSNGHRSIILIAKYPDGKSWSNVYESWFIDGETWRRWPHEFPPTHFQYVMTPA